MINDDELAKKLAGSEKYSPAKIDRKLFDEARDQLVDTITRATALSNFVDADSKAKYGKIVKNCNQAIVEIDYLDKNIGLISSKKENIEKTKAVPVIE